MRYFIIKRGIEYVIYKVKDEEILGFKEKYDKEILLEAGSFMQLLSLFEQDIMFSLEYSGNYHIHLKRRLALPEGNRPSDRMRRG